LGRQGEDGGGGELANSGHKTLQGAGWKGPAATHCRMHEVAREDGEEVVFASERKLLMVRTDGQAGGGR
jgi:hypothetical protein